MAPSLSPRSGKAGQGAAPLLALLLLTAALLAPLLFAGCEERIEALLEQAQGKPSATDPTGSVDQSNDPVPAGPHLYCVTNLGRTLVAFSLAEQRVRSGTRRVLWPDPTGPWFAGDHGYYLSQVASDGSGLNALVEFYPTTLVERRRLVFPPNSNPAAVLIPPGASEVWVALKGSTFDNFATNGVAVVALEPLAQRAYLNLNDSAVYPPGFAGGVLTSPLALHWDAACALGSACAYAIANNWRNGARQGWLLVLEPQPAAAPVIRDAVALGRNPMETLLRDGTGALWVVNNGGFIEAGGLPGSLQVLDPARFADGIAGNETLAVIDGSTHADFPPDPMGLYDVGSGLARLTTYPSDVVRTVNLAARDLLPFDPALPRLTGPLYATSSPDPALYAATGGFGHARLARLDPATGAVQADHDLASGNGGVTCVEHTVP
ncbi:MAG: hypothetical protein HY423_02215 [Candidatus Lambdaproteobacteria bacterium]|nr:hypothetical protein [Candidatus Lambdaproteobacteria bacterium]